MNKQKKPKRQHYIHQRYFENFSLSGDHLYVLPFTNGKFFSREIKDLAKEDFYFGSDEAAINFEKGLSKYEKQHIALFRKIISNCSLELLDTDEDTLLRFFTLFQESRTKSSKQFSQYFAHSLTKRDNPDIDIFQKVPRGVNRGIGDQYRTTFGWTLNAPTLTHESISDLKVTLIVNTTNNSFICSDAPVVRFNQLKIDNERLRGLFSPGLEIFYPINNEILLLFYDPKAYDIDFDYDSIYYLDKQADLDSLNSLQFINAIDFVLFSDVRQGENIESLYQENQKLIHKIVQQKFGSYEKGKKILKGAGENYWNIFCTISKYFNYDLNLSFIHLRKDYEQYWLKEYQESRNENKKPELIRNRDLKEKVLEKINQATKITK